MDLIGKSLKVLQKICPEEWKENTIIKLLTESEKELVYLVANDKEKKVVLKWTKVKSGTPQEIAINNEYYSGAKASKATQHAVKPYALGFTTETNSESYTVVVTEYKGESISKYKDQLSKKDIFNIAYQLSIALSELHKAGLAHMDVKPANILWQGPNTLLALSDFGDSISLDESSYSLGVSEKSPTFPYAAPEVFDATRGAGTLKGLNFKKADSFAFGIVILELFLVYYKREGLFSYLQQNWKEFEVFLEAMKGFMEETGLSKTCIGKIIYKCIKHEEEKRPDFNWIRLKLEEYFADSEYEDIVENEKENINACNNNTKQFTRKLSEIEDDPDIRFVDFNNKDNAHSQYKLNVSQDKTSIFLTPPFTSLPMTVPDVQLHTTSRIKHVGSENIDKQLLILNGIIKEEEKTSKVPGQNLIENGLAVDLPIIPKTTHLHK